MGKLEEALVERLLETTPAYKRDVMENTIRALLGAERLETVTGLPARRGGADGGIDGILFTSNSSTAVEMTRTALNIKVRESDFSREQLGGFLLDMDREGISSGIIITAASLSPDAAVELVRKNRGGAITLHHIRLADILSGELGNLTLFINHGHVTEALNHELRAILAQP
jgi:predicted helicase